MTGILDVEDALRTFSKSLAIHGAERSDVVPSFVPCGDEKEKAPTIRSQSRQLPNGHVVGGSRTGRDDGREIAGRNDANDHRDPSIENILARSRHQPVVLDISFNDVGQW